MSGSASPALATGAILPTVPAYPATTDLALAVLALMGVQSGVLTDYNVGSIVRTQAESFGAVVELQGLAEQTLAYQTMVYGALAALGIQPLGAQPATGQVTFLAPGPATQAVSIPAGTLLQTAGGVQFQTVSGTVLASGAASVQTAVQAASGGTAGNVPASGIAQILSGLAYPLTVANALPTAGGSSAEALSATLARFSAALAAPGLASPVAVADGAVGIIGPGGERVAFSSVYEPWVASSGASGLGFTLFLDNGTGTASSGLIAAVQTAISGSPGFRPAGVPYTVSSAGPTFATVSVTGTMLPAYDSASGTTAASISGAVSGYVSGLVIGQTVYAGNLAAVVGSAGEGQLASLSVSLSGAAGSGLTSITPSYSGRVVLAALSVSIA